ncbi:MAG TPA: hypothetical protein VFD42_06845, partial [Chloroflexota bacterium]|nr:hypothetical protein [Chloroflexota bacterium]
MVQLAIETQGLAPGMWAVISKVISWEWLESSGRVRWVVETVLSPSVIRSAIPSVVSIGLVKPNDPRLPARKPAVRRRAVRKRALPVAVS